MTDMIKKQVFGLIAQEDSRNSATIAEKQTFISQRAADDSSVMRSIARRQVFISERAADDSRVMRRIGLLTALFLPITLVTVSHTASCQVWPTT